MPERSATFVDSSRRSPLNFFCLVFLLSLPFWLLGAFSSVQLLPGLPLSSFEWVCPVVAAAVLVYRENRIAGLIELLERSFDYKRIRTKAWYAPVIVLMPGVTFLAYGWMRLMGLPLPALQFSVPATIAMFLAFFVPAVCEELGWSAYAIDPMQDRWNALEAATLLGLVWAVWHYVPLVQAHRSMGWIAAWSLYTIASRVLIVWLYNNTGGSVFAAALYHDIGNLCWQLFPNHGSHWDPRFMGPIVALIAAIVTLVWGPQTLTRYRYAR